MAAVTILDLNNAKTDVDHIGDIANSPLLTAIDRLGHLKNTIAGMMAAMQAQLDAALDTASGEIGTQVAAAQAANTAAQGAAASAQALAGGNVQKWTPGQNWNGGAAVVCPLPFTGFLFWAVIGTEMVPMTSTNFTLTPGTRTATPTAALIQAYPVPATTPIYVSYV